MCTWRRSASAAVGDATTERPTTPAVSFARRVGSNRVVKVASGKSAARGSLAGWYRFFSRKHVDQLLETGNPSLREVLEVATFAVQEAAAVIQAQGRGAMVPVRWLRKITRRASRHAQVALATVISLMTELLTTFAMLVGPW